MRSVSFWRDTGSGGVNGLHARAQRLIAAAGDLAAHVWSKRAIWMPWAMLALKVAAVLLVIALCRHGRRPLLLAAVHDVFPGNRAHDARGGRLRRGRRGDADVRRRRAPRRLVRGTARGGRSCSISTAMAARCITASSGFAISSATASACLGLEYRGYAGSTGSPSETGLIADGEAAYAYVAARYPASQIVALGRVARHRRCRRARGREAGRPGHPGSTVHIGGGGCQPALLVSAGSAFDEGSIPLGRAHRKDHRAGADPAWRARPHRPLRHGRAAVRADQGAEAHRAIPRRRPRRSRRATARCMRSRRFLAGDLDEPPSPPQR